MQATRNKYALLATYSYVGFDIYSMDRSVSSTATAHMLLKLI